MGNLKRLCVIEYAPTLCVFRANRFAPRACKMLQTELPEESWTNARDS